MPFEPRFNQVAEIIGNTVKEFIQQDTQHLTIQSPKIERLDWVTSSGVIQTEIWEKIAEADLVFCDITGFNPNVMFELGVASAWKKMEQVVLLKDKFFKQPSAFDISPIRYTEYELTSEGIDEFKQKVTSLILNTLISFPDNQIPTKEILTPLHIDFSSNVDCFAIYTPPYAHRFVSNGYLVFGSKGFFSHSWASIGNKKFSDISLSFTAHFENTRQEGGSWIGVGLRSLHFFANYAHILYLKDDGQIFITQPNETPPTYYTDILLRSSQKIDIKEDHLFRINFTQNELDVKVDDFSCTLRVSEMPKVFQIGLIRLQSWCTWMAIKSLDLD